MMELGKVHEKDIYNLKNTLGLDVYKKYIQKLISQGDRIPPTIIYDMTPQQQLEYVKNMFMQPDSPGMAVQEWRRLKDEVKSEVEDLAPRGDRGESLTKSYIRRLKKIEMEEREEERREYYRNKYI
jgi:hypothetical protein